MRDGILGREGKIIKARTIAQILENPVNYTGKIICRAYEQGTDESGKCRRKKDADGNLIKTSNPVEYDCEPYWDEATFLKLKAMGEDNYSFRKKRDEHDNVIEPVCPSISKGHIFCGLCNYQMHPKPGRPRKDGTRPYYYRCNNKTWDKSKAAIDEVRHRMDANNEKLQADINSSTRLCKMSNIRIEKIDNIVHWELCRWVLYPSKYIEQHYLHVDQDVREVIQKQIDEKESQIKLLENEINGCYKVIGKPGWDEAKLSKQVVRATEEKKRIDAELSELVAKRDRMLVPEKVDELEKKLGHEQERAAFFESLKALPISEWLEIMNWFFPKGKDDTERAYGIYVMPREVANIDTEKIDNAPPDTMNRQISVRGFEELKNDLPGEFVIELNGVLNTENISKLIDRLRSKKQYTEHVYEHTHAQCPQSD